jgi:hypothetical protein
MSLLFANYNLQLAAAPPCQGCTVPRAQARPWCLWRAGDARRAAFRQQTGARRRPAARRHPSAASSKAAEPAPATATALPADFSLVSPCGRWRVRPVHKGSMDELRRVVVIQSQAFYEGSPLPMLDGMFRNFFMAEVLSEMQKKVKFNPSERFVLLVAERFEQRGGSSGSGSGGSNGGSAAGSSSGAPACGDIVGKWGHRVGRVSVLLAVWSCGTGCGDLLQQRLGRMQAAAPLQGEGGAPHSCPVHKAREPSGPAAQSSSQNVQRRWRRVPAPAKRDSSLLAKERALWRAPAFDPVSLEANPACRLEALWKLGPLGAGKSLAGEVHRSSWLLCAGVVRAHLRGAGQGSGSL